MQESGETDDGCALSPNPSFDLSNHTFKSDPSGLLQVSSSNVIRLHSSSFQIHNSSTESQSSITHPNKTMIQDDVKNGGGRYSISLHSSILFNSSSDLFFIVRRVDRKYGISLARYESEFLIISSQISRLSYFL